MSTKSTSVAETLDQDKGLNERPPQNFLQLGRLETQCVLSPVLTFGRYFGISPQSYPITYGKNPLLLEPVLRHLSILKSLDYDTVCNFRSVCSAWNEVMIPHFFRVSKLSLLYQSDSSQKLHSILAKEPNRFRFHEIINPYKITDQPPQLNLDLKEILQKHGRFVINIHFHYQHYVRCQTELFIKMMKLCPRVQNLRIESPSFSEESLLENTSFPSITSLTLGCGRHVLHLSGNANYFYMYDAQTVENILKATPNINILRLWFGVHRNGRFPKTPLKGYLEICQKVGYLENLTELNLWKQSIGLKTLEYLSKIRFNNLKKLIIGEMKMSDSVTIRNLSDRLDDLLFNVSHSLEELLIQRWMEYDEDLDEDGDEDDEVLEEEDEDYDPVHIGNHFDRTRNTLTIVGAMPEKLKLKKLTFNNWTRFETGTIEVISRFPNIQSFTLHSMDCKPVNQFFTPTIRFEHRRLRELELKTKQLSSSALQNIVNMFPALEKVRLHATNIISFISEDEDEEEDEDYEIQQGNVGMEQIEADVETQNSFANWLEILSQLQKLVDLEIVRTLEEADFNAAIQNKFRMFKALKRFSFTMNTVLMVPGINNDYDIRHFKIHRHTIIDGFMRVDSLERIKLTNFCFQDKFEEEYIRAVIKTKGLKLEMTGIPVVWYKDYDYKLNRHLYCEDPSELFQFVEFRHWERRKESKGFWESLLSL